MRNLLLILALSALLSKGTAQDLNLIAQEFLASLPEKLKKETLYVLEDEERHNFNYVPISRKGPSFHDLSETQKQAAINLLRASLSEKGYWKVSEIIALEAVLKVLEKNRLRMADGSPMRDELNYHFTIFGSPEKDSFWGWRFEGHHVSLNFVASKGKLRSATPSFLGANPAVVPSGKSKGKEVLKMEQELGFRLVNSLTDPQLEKARFSGKAPREILTGNKRLATVLNPKGISYSELSPGQKTIFEDLLDIYLQNYKAEFAAELENKIVRAGMDQMYFAWAGSLSPGDGHYYRIQGADLLIEYDNTQHNANHIHTVVRDLTNDFGTDLLKKHYKENH